MTFLERINHFYNEIGLFLLAVGAYIVDLKDITTNPWPLVLIQLGAIFGTTMITINLFKIIRDSK